MCWCTCQPCRCHLLRKPDMGRVRLCFATSTPHASTSGPGALCLETSNERFYHPPNVLLTSGCVDLGTSAPSSFDHRLGNWRVLQCKNLRVRPNRRLPFYAQRVSTSGYAALSANAHSSRRVQSGATAMHLLSGGKLQGALAVPDQLLVAPLSSPRTMYRPPHAAAASLKRTQKRKRKVDIASLLR